MHPPAGSPPLPGIVGGFAVRPASSSPDVDGHVYARGDRLGSSAGGSLVAIGPEGCGTMADHREELWDQDAMELTPRRSM